MEKLVKNQASKKNQCSLQLAREKLARRVTLERPRVKHMTRSEKSCQAVKFASTSRERPSHEVSEKLSIWQKEKVFYQILYPHYIYSHYPQNVRSAFREKTIAKTLES